MERKEAANGLQLIKLASIKLRGHFSALFMGTLAMTTPLVLILFMSALMTILFNVGWILPIGIVLFAILVGPLQVGYIKYFNGVLDGKQPRIGVVYSQLRFNIFTLRTIYISGILMVLYVVGGVLWIVPAGFAVSFYSMTLFFLEKYEYPRLSMAMNECSHKMIGNRLAMFSYKLIFYFVYFMLFILAFAFIALVDTLASESLLISWLIAVCSALVFIFIYTLVTVYFHSSNQIFFEDVLAREERKRMAKVKTDSNSTTTLENTQKTSEEVLDKKEPAQESANEESLQKESPEDSKTTKTAKTTKDTKTSRTPKDSAKVDKKPKETKKSKTSKVTTKSAKE